MHTNWLAAQRIYLSAIVGGNFLWEIALLPLYTIGTTGTLGEKALAIVHCTIGDFLIALGSIGIALIVAGRRDWPVRRFWPVAAIAITLGLIYTAYSEFTNTIIRPSWEYSNLMPIVHVFDFDLGLSPIAQWIAVPSLAFWLVWRWRAQAR